MLEDGTLLDEASGSFSIVAPMTAPAQAAPPALSVAPQGGANWALIGGGMAGVIIVALLVFLVVRQRRKTSLLKRKLISYLILLACVTLQAAPVVAAGGNGTTEATGTVPLLASNVATSGITTASATISWNTNGNATSQVFYDNIQHDSISDYSNNTTVDASLVLAHRVSLAGLSAGTIYHYRVRSTIPPTDLLMFPPITPSLLCLHHLGTAAVVAHNYLHPRNY